MATVATTTNGSPLQYPGTTKVDYNPTEDKLYVVIVATTANTFEVYRSSDNLGTSWSLYSSFVRPNVQELGPIFCDPEGWMGIMFRTLEGGTDRIWYQRMDHSGAWSPEILIDQFAHGGPAGTVYNGMDFFTVNIYAPQRMQKTVLAVGTNSAGNQAVSLYGVIANVGFNPELNNGILVGPRQLSAGTGSGHVGPSLDLEWTISGKGAGSPSLWLAFGRTKIYTSRLAWNGSGWLNQTTGTQMTGSIAAMDQLAGRFDGTRFLVPRPEGSTVRVHQRNKANTSNTSIVSPAHTAGAVRQCSVSYNVINGDTRVYAVGTSNNDLYYIDYVRQTASWSSWATVTTTDILGAAVDNWTIRRGSTYTNKHDVVTAHSGAPNTIVHAQLTLAYPPTAPTWVLDAVPYQNGSAADASAALLLDWKFNDPDPNDTQSAYALSRQIGSSALEYWRASDGTWQATEQKNTTSTTQVTLPTGFVDRFTSTVSGWTPTSSTFVFSSVQARTIPASGLLTVTGTPVQAFVRTGNIAVSATTSYSAELWGLSIAGYGDFGVAIDWYTAGSVYISTSTSGGSALSAGVWGRRSVTATSPGTAAFAQVGPTVGSNPPTSTAVYVDDVTFGPTPTPWGAASDLAHTFRVKTWDSADVASTYSDFLVIVPSAKVNPTITVPLDSSTYTTESLMVTWTVSEQSAFQVKLFIFGSLLHDSGKRVSSDTTYAVPYQLINGFSFSVQVWTWNNEGLQSDTVQSNFAVAFVPPPLPTHFVAPNPAAGIVRVYVTNPGASVFQSTGTATHGNNASVTPGLPAGMVATDAMFVVSAIRNSGTGVPNLPSGYTNIALFGNVRLAAKVHTGSESAPLCSFTGGVANADTTAQMVAFRRAGITLLTTPATLLNGSAQNIAYPALTVPANNCIVFYIGWKQAVNTGTSVPAGFTEIGDLSTATGDDQMLAWGYQIQTTATNIGSGTLTVTGGVSAISRAILVAVSGIPSVLGNDVYRLKTGDPLTNGTRVVQNIPLNGSGDDWRAPAVTDWSYRVVAIGENGATTTTNWSPV